MRVFPQGQKDDSSHGEAEGLDDSAATGSTEWPTPQPGSVEEIQLGQAFDRLRGEQNLAGGVLGGALGAFLGAAAWAAIVVFTGYQSGLVAIGVGMVVGYGVRWLGRGVDRWFGVVGALWALAGCALGNLAGVVGLAARESGVSFFEVWSQLEIANAIELMKLTFSPIDLLFYGIAVYEGYRYSFRKLTPSELGLDRPTDEFGTTAPTQKPR